MSTEPRNYRIYARPQTIKQWSKQLHCLLHCFIQHSKQARRPDFHKYIDRFIQPNNFYCQLFLSNFISCSNLMRKNTSVTYCAAKNETAISKHILTGYHFLHSFILSEYFFFYLLTQIIFPLPKTLSSTIYIFSALWWKFQLLFTFQRPLVKIPSNCIGGGLIGSLGPRYIIGSIVRS